MRGINKTDVLTLSSSFGSLKNIINCSMEELSLCPGLGARKVKNLYDAFYTPLDSAKKKKRQKTEESPQQIESFLKKMKDKQKDGKEDIQEEEGNESLGKEEIELNEAEEEKGNNNNSNNNMGTSPKQESPV